jgi:DNA-binding LacI/PurR family transcriptional regulator
LCRGIPAAQIPTVDCNNYLGMKILIDYLVGLGHTRLAFIDAGWLGDIRERLDAFIKITSELGFKEAKDYIQTELNDYEGGYRAMQRLLACSPAPTAVCASDDVMALGALRALQDAGKQVPQDISLVGFDGIDLVRFVTPRLTTVRQPIETMSSQTLDLLLNLIAHNNLDSLSYYIQAAPELIVGESTGPACLS